MKKGTFIAGIIIVFIIFMAVRTHKPSVESLLKNDSTFEYVSPITNSSQSGLKANVYSTDLKVSETASYIINKTSPEDFSDLSSTENISILYKNNYAFVYEGEDNKTYVQLSSREYAYVGSSSLYRSRHRNSHSFFRDYYFYKALTRDRDRYSTRSYYGSSYKPYYKTGSVFNSSKSKSYTNTSNKKSSGFFSGSGSSVRRSSTKTRGSLGGGTSFGK